MEGDTRTLVADSGARNVCGTRVLTVLNRYAQGAAGLLLGGELAKKLIHSVVNYPLLTRREEFGFIPAIQKIFSIFKFLLRDLVEKTIMCSTQKPKLLPDSHACT